MNEINGIINIYKETGFTSFDVVAKLKGMLKTKKIGHTGTLDPEAVGVLPVCIGNATKVCDLLMDERKEYIAGLRLGLVTDSQDTSGNILEDNSKSISNCNKEEITGIVRNCIPYFLGKIEQIPPMHSAIKVNGQKLYDLARKGIEVERKPRQVSIFDIEILVPTVDGLTDSEGRVIASYKDIVKIGTGPVHRFYEKTDGNAELTDEEMAADIQYADFDSYINDPGLLYIRVACSKGTYIRTLCEDIGKKTGFGGCMESLLRTGVGRFDIRETIKLSELQKLVDIGEGENKLLPVDTVFERYRELHVLPEGMKALLNGNQINTDLTQEGGKVNFKAREVYRVYGSDGKFYALYEYHSGWKVLKTVKMFI